MTNMLSFDQKYAVLGTKDKTFEGVFITAVKTTGIFCRPSCRARRPNPENVIFYDSVAEAIQNGYRSCKICKPLEQIDTTPQYIQAIINKLIETPHLKISDQDLIDQNIQPHNIRRWFQSNYNLTFHAFQRMLRVNDAFTRVKKGQSITDAAFQSGYESLSGFNDRFSSIFGKSASNIKDQKVIYITRLTTPIGAMFGCATENGLCLLEFTDRKNLEAQFEDLKKQYNAVILPGKSKHLEQTKKELKEYFEEKRMHFEVKLDPLGTEFRQSVWKALISIPFGQTRTYKGQSLDMNRPKAIRAIASANGANKIAILIPCHRVIGSDGSLTGYAGGIYRKKWLLEHEGVTLE